MLYLIKLFIYKMNNKELLKRKRSRKDNKSLSNSKKNINLNSPITDFNGFNIVELYPSDSNENKNLYDSFEFSTKNIIKLKESNMNISELSKNNLEIKEMTRAKVKNIEEYYSSKYGVCQIKENCFKCLMTNFLSNELLYFDTRKDLFNYIKYCFVSKNQNLFMDDNILKQNKENFFMVNATFLNGWRFFIPKTICKGCFMQIINMKHLLFNIKTIFSDIDRDSSCRTNYRNFALFSRRFRSAFGFRSRSRQHRRQTKSLGINRHIKKNKNNNNDGIILRNENLSDNEEIKIKNREKIFNKGVKVDKIKKIININKKILDNSTIEKLNNKSFYIGYNVVNNKNKDIPNDGKNFEKMNHGIYINLKDDKNKIEILNNIKNQNNILDLNHEEIYKDSQYIDLLYNNIKELSEDMFNILENFFESLNEIKKKIQLIVEHSFYILHKFNVLRLYPILLKKVSLSDFECLYASFEIDKKYYKKNLLNTQNCLEKMIKSLNSILSEIKKNNKMNTEEKHNFITSVTILKNVVDENKRKLDLYDEPIDNFLVNFECFFGITYKLVCP